MKYIFDFDRVLFHTEIIRDRIFYFFEKFGVPKEEIKNYLQKERWNLFSLKKMLRNFSLPENLYGEIMKENKNLVDKNLLKLIKKIGKENCYILSYGDTEFQSEKINDSDISQYFTRVIIIQADKNKEIEKICNQYPQETIFFIDDSQKHIEELDLEKCPNLKTILFKGQNIESYLQ
ncbi:MAG: hypothetical protein AAB902_00395 [Patescibacteria group bacterium]